MSGDMHPDGKGATILDVDGNALEVRWNLIPKHCAVIIAPADKYSTLDLAGIAALRAVLDKAEARYLARTVEPITARNDSACEPSIVDRIFKTPACEAFDKANNGSRYNTRIEAYEVCPGIRGAWQVLSATHPATPGKDD